MNAFRGYEADALDDVARWERHFGRLPAWQRALLPAFPAKIAGCRERVAANAAFFADMLKCFDPREGGSAVPSHLAAPQQASSARPPPTAQADVEKVRYVLKVKNILFYYNIFLKSPPVRPRPYVHSLWRRWNNLGLPCAETRRP